MRSVPPRAGHTDLQSSAPDSGDDKCVANMAGDVVTLEKAGECDARMALGRPTYITIRARLATTSGSNMSKRCCRRLTAIGTMQVIATPTTIAALTPGCVATSTYPASAQGMARLMADKGCLMWRAREPILSPRP